MFRYPHPQHFPVLGEGSRMVIMKYVTLSSGLKCPVLFSVFDMNNSLLEENFETEAKNATDAIKKYNPDLIVKRDGSKYAEICVSTFFISEGVRYKYGRRTWYKVI